MSHYRAFFPDFVSLAILLLAILVAPISSARAEESYDTIQTLYYDVYASGIHVVEAKVTMDFTQPGRYSLVLDAHTRGFLGTLAPWEGVFESHGWIGNGGDYKPQTHKSTTTWRDEKEIKEYSYTKTGGFRDLQITEHDKPTVKSEIDTAITKDTTDALTAALMVFDSVGRGEDCTGASDVFDGKRRFSQIFNHENDVMLGTSRYNVYAGPAAQCTVEVKPISGEWHKKPRGWMSIQEQGRARGTMPTIWLAALDPDAPAVPIKILVKTAYGSLFMHLAEYQNEHTILIADKRRDD